MNVKEMTHLKHQAQWLDLVENPPKDWGLLVLGAPILGPILVSPSSPSSTPSPLPVILMELCQASALPKR